MAPQASCIAFDGDYSSVFGWSWYLIFLLNLVSHISHLSLPSMMVAITLTAAFAVMYVVTPARWAASIISREDQIFAIAKNAILLVLALATIPFVGWTALTFLPFLVAAQVYGMSMPLNSRAALTTSLIGAAIACFSPSF